MAAWRLMLDETGCVALTQDETGAVSRLPWVDRRPGNFASLAELTRRAGLRTGPHALHFVVQGVYAVDQSGQPFERCWHRDGETRVEIRNYSGIRSLDLSSKALSLRETLDPATRTTCWLLEQEAVRSVDVRPWSAEDELAPHTDDSPPMRPDRISIARDHTTGVAGVSEATEDATNLPHSRQEAEPFRDISAPPLGPVVVRMRLWFRDLRFGEEEVIVEVKERGWRLPFPHKYAFPRLNDVRVVLDGECGSTPPLTLRVEVADSGDVISRDLFGLEEVMPHVERLRHAWSNKLKTYDEFRDMRELARSYPAGDRAAEPEHMLEFAELGWPEARKEAFRKLFGRRDRDRALLLAYRDRTLIPIRAQDSGPDWLILEVVAWGNATYFFRPATEVQRQAVISWAMTPNPKRRLLRTRPALKQELAFEGLEEHRGEGVDLKDWWQAVCERLAPRVAPNSPPEERAPTAS